MEDRRISQEQYDPGRLLTLAALFFVGILIVFVAGIIGVQIWKSGDANVEVSGGARLHRAASA